MVEPSTKQSWGDPALPQVLFGGAYNDAKPFERPKYGALSVGAPRSAISESDMALIWVHRERERYMYIYIIIYIHAHLYTVYSSL